MHTRSPSDSGVTPRALRERSQPIAAASREEAELAAAAGAVEQAAMAAVAAAKEAAGLATAAFPAGIKLEQESPASA